MFCDKILFLTEIFLLGGIKRAMFPRNRIWEEPKFIILVQGDIQIREPTVQNACDAAN